MTIFQLACPEKSWVVLWLSVWALRGQERAKQRAPRSSKTLPWGRSIFSWEARRWRLECSCLGGAPVSSSPLFCPAFPAELILFMYFIVLRLVLPAMESHQEGFGWVK